MYAPASVEKENGCSVFFFSDGLLVIVRLRCWIRFAVFLLTYIAPRRALQLAHDPTMFARSYGSPPWSSSVTWSAWLLGCRLHQWHTGSSWMTWARSSFHRLVVYIGLPLIVLEHRSRDTDAHAEKGTRRGCPRLSWVTRKVCVPHYLAMSRSGSLSSFVRWITSRLCVRER